MGWDPFPSPAVYHLLPVCPGEAGQQFSRSQARTRVHHPRPPFLRTLLPSSGDAVGGSGRWGFGHPWHHAGSRFLFVTLGCRMPLTPPMGPLLSRLFLLPTCLLLPLFGGASPGRQSHLPPTRRAFQEVADVPERPPQGPPRWGLLGMR